MSVIADIQQLIVLEDRALAPFVPRCEEPQAGDLAGRRLDLRRTVVVGDADQSDQPLADRPHDLAVDDDLGRADPLQDGAHPAPSEPDDADVAHRSPMTEHR